MSAKSKDTRIVGACFGLVLFSVIVGPPTRLSLQVDRHAHVPIRMLYDVLLRKHLGDPLLCLVHQVVCLTTRCLLLDPQREQGKSYCVVHL